MTDTPRSGGLLSVPDALEMLLSLAPETGVETVPLFEADGRVLAEPAIAERDQPPFPASAMDGYALRGADAIEGAELTVIGEAAAGHAFTGEVSGGEAVRIFTGAPIPAGADTILIQENATRKGDRITVAERPEQGAFLRPSGGDFRAGHTIPAGTRLSPRDLALLAAMNIATLPVRRKPLIALIPTGDELVEPGTAPGPDQIISSNPYGLGASLRRAGADIRLCPIAKDTEASLLTALEAARGADILVTLGGASVGDHDLVAKVFGGAGLSLDFYKVAMRPGKPLMAGRIDGMMMVGLPGNPVSAMVCGEIFLRPVIDRALGLATGPRLRHKARLAHDIEPNGNREHYMRARIGQSNGGPPPVEIFENQDSSRIATLARANALVVRAPGAPASTTGEVVDYIPLD